MNDSNKTNQKMGHETQGHVDHHHIMPDKVALLVGGTLLVLTAVTIIVSRIDLGAFNFPVAMLIATIKALLVILFFMNLLYEARENSVIFGAAFLFLGIFLVLTSTDIFFRGNVYVKMGSLTAGASNKSSLKNPWISTPELVAHGKELFAQNCVTCHGPEGLGNGVAAAGYNPPPRNFHAQVGWINGRKPSNIFKTLKEGIAGSGMASFATLPVDDRWALAAYVVTFNSEKPVPDTQEDVAKINYDLKTGFQIGGGDVEQRTVPVEFAIERMAIAEHPEITAYAHASQASGATAMSTSPGAQLFQARCAECHGEHGEGGIRVRSLGGWPKAYVTTSPLFATLDSVKSSDVFNRVVVNGLAGREMPASGDLSGAELSELQLYVKSLGAALGSAR
jgi:caa(3)-type oxidase subunit IV